MTITRRDVMKRGGRAVVVSSFVKHRSVEIARRSAIGIGENVRCRLSTSISNEHARRMACA